MYAYLYMIGSDRRTYITHISFVYQGSQQRQAFEQLSGCTSLKTLDIMVLNETMKGARKPRDDLFKAKGMGTLMAIRCLASCKVTVREVATIENGSWRDPKRGIRCLNTGEKRRFDERNIKKVEMVLGDNMTSEENKAQLQLKRAREERREKQDRTMDEWRAKEEMDWQEFKKKEAERLERADKGVERG